MEKIFSNKKFAYIVIGILIALQLTRSIANWCGRGFNGGSLILCILMVGLLTLVGIGIGKNNKLLTIISGVAILSVFIYVKTNDCSGIIAKSASGEMTVPVSVAVTLIALGTLLVLGSFILAILKAFGIKKDFKKMNAIFGLSASVLYLVPIFIGIGFSFIIPRTLPESLFSIFFALLIPFLGYQLEFKE